jgi:hypothetical protein
MNGNQKLTIQRHWQHWASERSEYNHIATTIGSNT